MPPLLQVSGLNKTYAVPVLTDFAFDLAAGEVHALVGSNGAGKSTFAKILCGITRADKGVLLLEGRPYGPGKIREAEHAGVVMVMQERPLPSGSGKLLGQAVAVCRRCDHDHCRRHHADD